MLRLSGRCSSVWICQLLCMTLINIVLCLEWKLRALHICEESYTLLHNILNHIFQKFNQFWFLWMVGIIKRVQKSQRSKLRTNMLNQKWKEIHTLQLSQGNSSKNDIIFKSVACWGEATIVLFQNDWFAFDMYNVLLC